MKTITPPFLKFSAVACALAVLFRFGLSAVLNSQQYLLLIAVAILYFTGMFLAGRYFGIKDRSYLPIHDIGFRFHLATYIIHNGVSELWFLMALQSKYEHIRTIHLTAAIWAVFLLIHFFFYLKARSNAIMDLDKRDLFD